MGIQLEKVKKIQSGYPSFQMVLPAWIVPLHQAASSAMCATFTTFIYVIGLHFTEQTYSLARIPVSWNSLNHVLRKWAPV